jgi:CheY-like chemotaxis protein/HPt (histidine-containing phosphotransfer) domain-containing protein
VVGGAKVAKGPLQRLLTRHSLMEARTQKLKVLVADDNSINQQLMVAILDKLGIGCDIAANGLQVLGALEAQPYDLVLMDCEMPVMDGFAATASIRRREAGGRRVPIVAVTAHALESERQRCLAVGMDDWLVKPLGAAPLRAVLERWLAGPTSAAEERLDPDVWAGLWRIEAGGQPGTVAHLVSLFLEDAAVRLTRMRAALASADGPALARQAHAFKGGCRQVGAVGLEMIAVRLEEAARSGEIAGLEGQIDELESALACLEPLLRSRAAAPFRMASEDRQGDGPVPIERRDSLRIASANSSTEDTTP